MTGIKKIVFTGLLVATMLISSAPAIALAQEAEAPEHQGALISQVAEILGIDQQELENALKQAQIELQEGNRDAIVQELIAEGTLTQEQADEHKAWMESRPADIPNVGPRQLKKLLDEGEISQEQMDALKAWIEARPDMPEIRPELRQNVASKLQEHRDTLTARVAEILDISKESLENAFEQALGELRQKALDNRLQELVNQGAWTQQQADEYKAWIEARPDVPRIGLMGPQGQMGSQRPGGPQGPMGPQGSMRPQIPMGP
jgi:polyhydroxyalkanoate synthesis regulator phasin